MRKSIYLKEFIVLMLILSLFGCTKDKKTVNTNPEQLIDITKIGTSEVDYQSYWGQFVRDIAKADGGYYYLTKRPRYLMYFDESIQSSYRVCGKADCNHNNQNCNAFFGSGSDYGKTAASNVTYSPGSIYFYKGYIYMLSSEGNLVRITPDGSERVNIAQVYTFDSTSNTKLVFYGDYVYVYNSMGHLGIIKEYTETIKRFSLDGKTQDTIFEYTGTNSAIINVRNYGNSMFFIVESATQERNGDKSTYQYNYHGLYTYNLKSGEIGKVLDAQIVDYSIDEKNNIIYYYVVADGLYKLDLSTKENTKIYNATDKSGFVELSFDGKYIYLNNTVWSDQNSTTENKIEKVCWVLNDHGSIINTIPSDRNLRLYFGDDKYLFAQSKASTGKTNIVYINKSNIESAQEWIPLP